MSEGTETIHNFQKKITLLGDPEVGKTSLIRRFVYDAFDDHYLATFGAKITKKKLAFPKLYYPSLPYETELTMMIWDIAGQKVYESIHHAYYRGTEGCFVVCDITRMSTLVNIRKWVSGLRLVAGDVPVLLLVNKFDLEDSIAFCEEEIEEICADLQTPFLFTSAKTGHNVEKAFEALGRAIQGLDW